MAFIALKPEGASLLRLIVESNSCNLFCLIEDVQLRNKTMVSF